MPENQETNTAAVHQPSEVREFLEVVEALHDATDSETGDPEAAYYLRSYLNSKYSIPEMPETAAPADPAPADPNPPADPAAAGDTTTQADPNAPADPTPPAGDAAATQPTS